jgi:hypothetical protein
MLSNLPATLAQPHYVIGLEAYNQLMHPPFPAFTSIFKHSYTPNHIHRINNTMPVPMHSTTEKSTSTSATAQTTSNVGNTSTQSVASASRTEQTEHEKEMERQYEERMEEEYAKREGGA